MARIRWSPLVQAALAAAALLPSFAATAQVTPGSSGATTSSSAVQSLSTTTTTTTTFSRDQTFVISGSNTSINGSLSIAGPPLGGVVGVVATPAVITQGTSTIQVQVSSTDARPVQAVVLNPSLNVTVRDPERDFDLAITQSTPGLTQVQRTDATTNTTQVNSSLSVFTAPFVP